MAYENYSQGMFTKKDTPMNRLASAVKGATAGKTMRLPNGKKAIKYPAASNTNNMNRVTPQPAIKVQDFDTGKKTTKTQLSSTSENSGEITKKQKDNTVPTVTAQKYSPKVDSPAKATQSTKGTVTKSSNNMSYASELGKTTDGPGKPQPQQGISGPAGSRKVAFASMKKGKSMPAKKPKVAGVTEVVDKSNNIAGAHSYGYRRMKKA